MQGRLNPVEPQLKQDRLGIGAELKAKKRVKSSYEERQHQRETSKASISMTLTLIILCEYQYASWQTWSAGLEVSVGIGWNVSFFCVFFICDNPGEGLLRNGM